MRHFALAVLLAAAAMAFGSINQASPVAREQVSAKAAQVTDDPPTSAVCPPLPQEMCAGESPARQ